MKLVATISVLALIVSTGDVDARKRHRAKAASKSAPVVLFGPSEGAAQNPPIWAPPKPVLRVADTYDMLRWPRLPDPPTPVVTQAPDVAKPLAIMLMGALFFAACIAIVLSGRRRDDLEPRIVGRRSAINLRFGNRTQRIVT